MNCPVCNSAMQSGEGCIARLSHGLALDLLMALGGGSQAATDFGLYFQSRGEQGPAVPIDQLRRVGVTWDEALAATNRRRKWPAERKEIPIAWAVPQLRQAGAFP